MKMTKLSSVVLVMLVASCLLAVASAADASPSQTSMGRLGRRLMQSWRGYDPYMFSNPGMMGGWGMGWGGPWSYWPGFRMNAQVSAQRMDGAVDRQFNRAGW